VIQRNAIASWLRVADEVILFGDEEDGVEAARDLGSYRVLPIVARNRFGTPLLSDPFRKAERMCRTPFLAYVNTDIILRDDFKRAVSFLPLRPVLVTGARRNADITEPVDFGDTGWSTALERRARKAGNELRGWNDYFLFRPRTLGELPPFAVGRPRWDGWLIFHAWATGVWVVDASPSVIVIHQNHDYSHVPHAVGSRWEGPEADENFRLAGGDNRLIFSLKVDASHRLENGKLVRNNSVSALRHSWDALPLLHPELAAEPLFFRRLTRPRRAVVPFLKPLTCRVYAVLNALRVPLIPVWRTLRR
jgi:hypothetical protein